MEELQKLPTDGNFVYITDFIKNFNDSNNKKKNIQEFWSNDSTKNVYDGLCNKLGLSILHKTTRGKGGGTWIHKELFPFLFNWLHEYPNLKATRDEIEFCNQIEVAFEGILKFERQKQFDNFRVDLFCEEIGLCIEYDELHHNKPSIARYDLARQSHIEEEFGMHFMRHNKKDSLASTINKIIKYKQAYNTVQCIKQNKVPRKGLL